MGKRLVAPAAVILAFVAASSAGAAGVFSDESGDQVNRQDLVGPDITMVELDHTPSVLGFRVTVGNYAAMPPSSRIAILFDLDKDTATGDQGFEHAVKYDVDAAGAVRVTFERFEPSQFALVGMPDSRITGSFADGTLTALVPRTELATRSDFEFGVYAVRFGANAREVAGDVAPNADLWFYPLVDRAAVKLAASPLVVNPRRPRAGKPFSIRSVVTRSDTGLAVAAGAVTCRARVGTTPLRVRGSFSSRRAHCAMSIPRNAKGKTLAGSLTVRSAGAVLTKRFSYRVA